MMKFYHEILLKKKKSFFLDQLLGKQSFYLFFWCFSWTEQVNRCVIIEPLWNQLRYLTISFSAQVCRLQRHLSAGEHQQDLFQSQPAMFVSQHSQPPTQSLVELIQLCGGTVCKSVRQAGICIGKYSGRRPEGSRILSEQWVLGKMLPANRCGKFSAPSSCHLLLFFLWLCFR